MRKTIWATAVAAVAFASALYSARAGTLIPLPAVSGSEFTHLTGINDKNLVVGYYGTSDYRIHGFLGTINGQYTSIDYGGVGDTHVAAISNDGHITGWWEKNPRDPRGDTVQFIRSPDGTFRRITLNGARMRGTERPGAIRDDGAFVGAFARERHSTGLYHKTRGYLGNDGDYHSEIVLPFRQVHGTYPLGLNKNGDIVGYFSNCTCGDALGFLIRNGVAQKIMHPDFPPDETIFMAINDSGLAVGRYVPHTGDLSEIDFLYNARTKKFKDLPSNGAFVAINNLGIVALDHNGPAIYCISKANCPSSGNAIDVPDKWMPAHEQDVVSVVCTRQCRKPLRAIGATASIRKL